MGQAGSQEEKARRSIAQAINESSRAGTFSEKKMRQIFALYDSDRDGVLRWNEAKRYLSDLLELSGNQAAVIREARDAGEPNVAMYYERLLRHCFDFLDVDKSGSISIEEMVRPSGSHVNDMLAAVRHLSSVSAPAKTNLVLSSKMRQEPSVPDELVSTGALCVGGCGFLGSPDTEGYCASCLQMILGASSTPAVAPTTVEAVVAPANVRRKKKKRVPPKTGIPPPKGKEEDGVGEADDSDSLDGAALDGVASASDSEQQDDFLETSNRERHDKFSVIDGAQVEKLMARRIKEAAELLGVSADEAALVLLFFDWNLQRLQERYFTDVDKYRRLAGIALPAGLAPRLLEDGDCGVCFDAVKVADTAALACGHGPYCRGCYGEYLHAKVSSGGAATMLATTCMSKGCPLRLSPMQWHRLGAPADFKRYHYFYLKHYVESSVNLGFCPNPNCTFVVKFSGLGRPADVVECMCGKRYCFACCAEAHNPISCEQLQVWLSKNSSDTESILFIQATSKQCPHCKMATERNEGCNHMTCSKESGGCGGQWCWMCRGDWSTHGSKTGGYFSCNLYDKSAAKKLDEQTASILDETQHFAHFYDRFVNHGQLERDAEDKRTACVTQWMPLYQRERGGLDPTFLLTALDLLVKCRHTLKMTYVYAWFQDSALKAKRAEPGTASKAKPKVRKGGKGGKSAPATEESLVNAMGGGRSLPMMETQQELFNYQQANLEGITERLGELIFSFPSAPSTFPADELRNLISVTHKYLGNLVAGFEDLREEEETEL